MGGSTKIIVMGAGYGGILTAKKLARRLGKREEVSITLIDRNTYHTMLTELHEVAAGRVPEQSVRINLSTVFAGRAVELVQDEILSVDLASRTLASGKAVYPYDYLILGTGSKPTFFGVRGAAEHCFQLWSYEDAVRLKAHIQNQFRRAANESDPTVRRNWLRIITVGCGFTGVELVGELAEWKPRLCREFGIDPAEVELLSVDVLPKVLPIFPEHLGRKAARHLERQGVSIHTGTGVQEVGADYAVLGNLGTVRSETVIWTAGIEGSALAESLALKKEARHRVVTNEYLQAVDDPRVFVVGDNIYALAGENQGPVPQMVENAERSAALVAHNVCALLADEPLKPYRPEFHGAMVSVGGRYGVAHLGLPGRFLSLSGFSAMFIKHVINLSYFFQVAGFSKCWSYLKYEFFKVPDRRSFVGGLLAKASPIFWVVPLRVFMGIKWLLEGVVKMGIILKNPSDVFLIPAPAVGTSSATIAATGTAQPAVDAVASATQTGAAAASQFGETLPVPEFISAITRWGMKLFFYTPDGGFTVLAQLFQAGIVLGEVAVGLCLIAGLFTFPASVAAILLCSLFWASGTSDHEILWYVAASIATMGGSGSVLGLDYYVLPWLKGWWNRLSPVRKWYLFID